MILPSECQRVEPMSIMKVEMICGPEHSASNISQLYAHEQASGSDVPRHIICRQQLWKQSGSHNRRDDRAMYLMSVTDEPNGLKVR